MALIPRPPVVTILGHVDHGKTSLLDYIRHTKVAAKEAGGITQHIGAYQASHQGKLITFLDTPGHAAFSKMRSRGAQATDFVVLVVAANDGVQPQTVESIQHIKAAEVPFIVAINKIDIAGVNIDGIKAQLAEKEVYVQGYGGDVEVVQLSAKTGQGVDTLLDTLLLMAEIEEIQADPSAPLEAVVIESTKDSHRGVISTLLIKQGTLQERDTVYAGKSTGKVKRMSNALGESIKEAAPGTPVEVLGFDNVPAVGEIVTGIQVVQVQPDSLQSASAILPLDFAALLGVGSPKLPVILKSDTVGTLQALEQSMPAEVVVISQGVGSITDSDILMAEASQAQVLAFSVSLPKSVQSFAEAHHVRAKTFRIIYELFEYVEKQVKKLTDPHADEKIIGKAEVIQTFSIKGEVVAGCKITEGEIKKNDVIRQYRGEKMIGEPKIKSLRTGKEEVDIRRVGDECGITFTRYSNVQKGDIFHAFVKIDE